MKFFKKMGVAVATLVLAIAGAVTIGKVRESGYTDPNPSSIQRVMKDYQDEDGMAGVTEMCRQYVIDNANVINAASEDRIVNTIANMALRDDGVIAVATENFAEGAVQAPEDLKKTAERLFDRIGLRDDEGAVMVLDVQSKQSYMYDPSGKLFSDMSDAEIRSIEAAIQKGFELVDKGDMNGVGTGIADAYDVVARLISDPSAFQDMNNAYVVEEDDGEGFSIVEKTVDGGISIVSGITKTVTGIARTAIKIIATVIGGIPIMFIVIGGIIFLLVRSNKKKNGQNGQGGKGARSGAPGAPGRGHRGPAGLRNGRNLSQSGNIDTSKISTEGSTYRWSANKNPYSGLNKGKGDMSGFVFPNDFGSGENSDQGTNQTR
ncbi:MAG: TPM domain-containing protein [Lachnospiraceae bacterium]|nr:TPM domain-containing protein [Lachnospiraceae bacterium]